MIWPVQQLAGLPGSLWCVCNFRGYAPPPHSQLAKAGIKLKPFAMGETILYGEYGQHNDMLSILAPDATGSRITQWGIGVVQNIDAAAMSLWLVYRSIDSEIEGGSSSDDPDTFKFVKAGTAINF